MTLETTSRVRSQATLRSSMATLTIKDTVAHDTQMRYSPSFLHSSLCRNGREQSQREGQPVMEGTQLRSVPENRSAQELWVTHFQDFVHCGARLSEVQSRRGEKVIVRECWSDVCDEVVNDKEHQNQCGLLASVMESRTVLNRIQCSRHVQRVLRCVREMWRGPEHCGEGCAGEGDDLSRLHSFRERHVRAGRP